MHKFTLSLKERVLNQEQWNKVDDYFSATLAPSDAVLDAALADSQEAGLPAINVAPNQGKLLHLLARISGARRILEIGTLGGYSRSEEHTSELQSLMRISYAVFSLKKK